MAIKPDEIGRLKLNHAIEAILGPGAVSANSPEMREITRNYVGSSPKESRLNAIERALYTHNPEFQGITAHQLAAILIGMHGVGPEFTEKMRELHSTQEVARKTKTKEELFWKTNITDIYRAATNGLFEPTLEIMKSGEGLSNKELHERLKKHAAIKNVRAVVGKGRKSAELVATTTRAFRTAGILKTGTSKAKGSGGPSKRYHYVGQEGTWEVDSTSKPILYVLDNLHKSNEWVGASRLYKPTRGRGGGNPEAPFDRRSIRNALSIAETHGLLEREKRAKNTLFVRMTPHGRASWKDHLKTGQNHVILAAAKRHKRK